MLHLICGPSGSGKTQFLTEAIKKDIQAGVHCLLLVPEQQVYTSEMTLSQELPSNAGLYLDILSFTGLSEKLFSRFGGLQFLNADRSVRSLIMWSVLRALSPLLSQYGKSGVEDSVVSLMQNAIEDLRINGIRPEQLQEATAALADAPLLQKKLSDLALVSSLYSERMSAIFGDKSPEERLTRLSVLLSEHAVFTDAHIYVDSFTSFTWDETMVLRELMKQAKETSISLCIDESASSLPHFKSILETEKDLKRHADKTDTPWEIIRLQRTRCHSDLSYLEENLWKFDAKPYEATSTRVRAVLCNTVFEECEAAAINILDLVQKGIHYDEIAVIVRDLETYRGWLDAALEKHGIPYFLSERNSFSKKPLARLILSALRTVLYGYSASDVFSLLKTGLSGIPFREASLFEEYVETWHISGKRFLDEAWSMNPDGLTTSPPTERGKEIFEVANRVRRELIPPLEKLSAEFCAGKTFSDYCEALYRYLIAIRLPDTLEELSKDQLKRANARDAGESVRLFGFLTELLGKGSSVLKDEELTAQEFLSAISLLFSAADLGSVPPTNDCVMLGSASMLRLEQVRATILLGLCEGEFPGDVEENGILTESEKEKLAALNLTFRSNAKIKQSEELFYVYRAVTKPTDALILSYPTTLDATGRTAPSIAYSRICELLKLTEEKFDYRALKATLAGPVESAPKTPAALLPKAEKSMRLSPSALEEYVACPYRYHLGATLSVRKSIDSLQGASESGNFLHTVFEKFLSSDEQSEESLQRIITDYIEALCGRPLEEVDAQLLHQFFRLSMIAKQMLYGEDGILKELKESGFSPIAFEQWGKIKILLGEQNEILLGGKIDRIDELKKDGKTYLRVVDYKSSKHTFVPADIPKGKELQLVLYLMAAAQKYEGTTKAGGMYVWPDETGSILKAGRDQFSVFSNNPKKSYVEGDFENELIEAVKDCAREILSGQAEKRPSKESCAFCPAKFNCDAAIRSKEY